MAGIDRADSVTLDPHKWFFQPMECGSVLIRDDARLQRTFAIHPAPPSSVILTWRSSPGPWSAAGPSSRSWHRPRWGSSASAASGLAVTRPRRVPPAGPRGAAVPAGYRADSRTTVMLPPPAIEGLAAALTPVEVPAGAVLIRQGDPGDAYYAIAAGQLDASRTGFSCGAAAAARECERSNRPWPPASCKAGSKASTTR